MKKCITCKHYIALSMMKRQQRIEFIKKSVTMGIMDYEDYGICNREEGLVIKHKDDLCGKWEAKEKWQ